MRVWLAVVATTAPCVMSLQVYYRYARVPGNPQQAESAVPVATREVGVSLDQEKVEMELVVEVDPAEGPPGFPARRFPASGVAHRAIALDPDYPEPRTGLMR